MAAEAAKSKGNDAFKAGQLELAVAHYSTAIQLDPSAVAYPLNRSLVYLKLGKAREAEKDAATALKLEPHHPKAHFRRAQALKAQQKLQLALKQFKEAKQHGAGPEVDAEIKAIELELATAAARQDTSHPPLDGSEKHTNSESSEAHPARRTAPPQPDATTPAPPSTSRLRAALDKQPPSQARPPSQEGEDLMRPVSSRKLTTSAATTSFAAMKQSRAGKEKSVNFASTTPQPVVSQPSSPSVLTRLNEPAPPATQQHARDTTRNTNESNVPALVPYPRPSPPPAAEIVPPTTAHALEMALLTTKRDQAHRYHVLKSIPVPELPSLLGSSLSPELLSHMLDALSFSNAQNSSSYNSSIAQTDDVAWKVSFIEALSRSARFSPAAGLLDSTEKAVVKDIVVAARSRLDKLEAVWFD
ncbi:hypothetical protein ACM66B_003408 [Microbotryomycetes sp. NB124-2]